MKNFLCIILILTLVVFCGFNTQAENKELDINYQYELELLSNEFLSNEQREAIVKKYDFAEAVNDGSYYLMSDTEKSSLIGTPKITNFEYNAEFDKATKRLEKIKLSGVKNNATRDDEIFYTVYTVCVKQETSVWCAAATIQQVLKTMNAYGVTNVTVPSQSSIMNTTGAGPGLQTLLNYVNSKQNAVPYIMQRFNGEQQLLACLQYANTHKSPVVLHMSTVSADVSAGKWPYSTGGHYCNLDGKESSGSWMVTDPYYYSDYVRVSGDEGFHRHSYADIEKVVSNKYGSNNKTIGY